MIDNLIALMPIWKQLLDLFNIRHTLLLSDLERVVYIEDNLDLGIKQGDRAKDGSVTQRVLQTRKPVKTVIDAEHTVYNVEYLAVGVPIYEHGEFCGVLLWAVTTDSIVLTKMAEELSSLATEVTASAEDFTENAMGLSETNQNLLQLMQTLNEQMKSIEAISRMVSDLAMQTKIIGLNASIEAARAGELGRGFAVVASETQRLAGESEKSAKEITQNLQSIQQRISEVFGFSQDIALRGEQQAGGAEELAAAMNHIHRLSEALKALAERNESTH